MTFRFKQFKQFWIDLYFWRDISIGRIPSFVKKIFSLVSFSSLFLADPGILFEFLMAGFFFPAEMRTIDFSPLHFIRWRSFSPLKLCPFLYLLLSYCFCQIFHFSYPGEDNGNQGNCLCFLWSLVDWGFSFLCGAILYFSLRRVFWW